MSKEPAEYQAYRNMMYRCYSPKDRKYSYYGGRGIGVCERWRRNIGAFLVDVGPRPSPAHTLDRIDNNKDYGPENCRWATRTVQSNNRNNNRWVTVLGERRTVSQWARHVGMPVSKLRRRLAAGWPPEAAIDPGISRNPNERDRRAGGRLRLVSVGDVTRSISEWAKSLGTNRRTIYGRLRVGWSLEEAVSTPLYGKYHMRNRTASG